MPESREGRLLALERDDPVRCSDWARATAMPAIGTFGSYRGYLLIEIPLPWPRDVNETPEAEQVQRILEPRGYRFQALVPSAGNLPREQRRVILYAGSEEGTPFSSYRRFETAAGPWLAATVARLLADADACLKDRAHRADGTVDVLVCGHGTRDRCCGRRGAALESRLRTGSVRAGTRIWRTSHLGGHRFAPTFLVLPTGTAWGFGDDEVINAVLNREDDFTRVAGHYRGCSGLGDPRVQALELEVLRAVGWSLLDAPRSGSVDGDRAQLTWSNPDGEITWTARVRAGRTFAQPDCLQPPSTATQGQTEWSVTSLRSESTPQPTGDPECRTKV